MRNNSTWARSALSPISWPSDAWDPWLLLATIVGVIVLNLAPGFAYLIAYSALHPGAIAARAFPPFQLLLAQLVTYVPVAVFLLAILPRLTRRSLEQLGIRRPSARDIAKGLTGAIAMWIAVVGVGGAIAALTHRHDTETAVALLKDLKSPLELTVFFLVACVFAPIVEELTFRVLVFNALTRVWSAGAAMAGSGALFGLVHAFGAPPSQYVTIGIPLACGGVVLAFVYASTRCFWSNVTTHACFNAVNVIALVVFHAT